MSGQDWEDYPTGAIIAGIGSAWGRVLAVLIAMILGGRLGAAIQDSAAPYDIADWIWHGASLLLVLLYPAFLVISMFFTSISPLVLLPMLGAILWFWFQENGRLGALFIVSALTAVHTSGLLQGGVTGAERVHAVIAGMVLATSYGAIRFGPALLTPLWWRLQEHEEMETAEEEGQADEPVAPKRRWADHPTAALNSVIDSTLARCLSIWLIMIIGLVLTVPDWPLWAYVFAPAWVFSEMTDTLWGFLFFAPMLVSVLYVLHGDRYKCEALTAIWVMTVSVMLVPGPDHLGPGPVAGLLMLLAPVVAYVLFRFGPPLVMRGWGRFREEDLAGAGGDETRPSEGETDVR